MVNGNYILYGDRPSSESEIVDDHVQTRTAERKTKRKPNRTANELQHSLNLAQLDNETDSVKYEKKVKEPRLLRYVPTTDVEEHFVTEKFETYDLKPTLEERPRRYAFIKKTKNPSDGSVNYAHSRSSSSCSSPNGNLPTISEHGEQYGTYRVRTVSSPPVNDIINRYESSRKLEKYFAKPREVKKFGAKGSHPDSLYRVPAESGAGAGRLARAMRMLRWPAALVVICVALAVFVYLLMPSNLQSDLEIVNSTYWETNAVAASTGAHLQNPNKAGQKQEIKETEKSKTQKHGPKTPEIDFYEADYEKKYDLISVIEKITENKPDRKLPIPPVFPEHIAPEVQYGNEKADDNKLRTPKLLEEENGVPSDSTVKPHITQKPEKPLAIYFKDATTSTESITKAETLNDFTIYGEKVPSKDGGRHKPLTVQGLGYGKPYLEPEPEIPPEIQEPYRRRPANADVNFTSGHSKFFGIGIEDAEKLQSTTQSSVYNTRVSPTLPTWRDGDDSTTKKYPVGNADVPQCHSPRLALCRGVLPYDLSGAAVSIGGVDITTLLPQIDYLVASNCSDRVRQFVCTLLEPECSPAPYPSKMPCYNLCQAIKDNCEGYVPRVLFPAFNCGQFARDNCVGARAPCSDREMACGDRTCVLRDWMCDGNRDCPGGEDERACSTCAKHEFDCRSGSCIPKQWLCDGYNDCPKGEDEAEGMCGREAVHGEPGEESAGSAPAPSVRRPNRLPETRQRSNAHRTGENDSSKELLITSDSSNALKRNFTRRPSPSRLTPYRPKLRLPPTTTPHSDDDGIEDKYETPKKTVVTTKLPIETKVGIATKITTPVKPATQYQEPENRESDENINPEDLGIFEDFEMEKKESTTPKPVVQPRFKSNRYKFDRAPPPKAVVEERPPLPGAVYEPSSGPMRVYAPAPVTQPQATRLDKSINQFEKIIDGAAMLRKAAAAAAEEARATANATEGYEDEYIRSRGTSHSSPCPSGELRCVDGRCITLSQLCDGTIDCTDHADEDNCFT